MVDPSRRLNQSAMSLKAAFGRWLACLMAILLVVSFSAQMNNPVGGFFVAIILYIACGVYLNRKVLPRIVDFHPVYNTLDNVTRDKLYMFRLWPISYPKLFWNLWVDKTL